MHMDIVTDLELMCNIDNYNCVKIIVMYLIDMTIVYTFLFLDTYCSQIICIDNCMSNFVLEIIIAKSAKCVQTINDSK